MVEKPHSAHITTWVTCDYQPEKREGDPGGTSCTEALAADAKRIAELEQQNSKVRAETKDIEAELWDCERERKRLEEQLQAEQQFADKFQDEVTELKEQLDALHGAAVKVLHEYDLWAEDANDGEFAIWRREEFMASFLELRQALSNPACVPQDATPGAATASADDAPNGGAGVAASSAGQEPTARADQPAEAPLPTTADLIGLVPDMTGDRTAVEHVRWLRGDDNEESNPAISPEEVTDG